MKVCGVIAEFNPFHQGHAYLLEQARKQIGADVMVVVMSGNWVQRGEPAIEQNGAVQKPHFIMGLTLSLRCQLR